jgi:hypothetical protein
MIRHLELINTDETIQLHHLQLATLLGRLTGLDMLIWDGYVNIPIYVLMELRTLRRAKLTIKATGIFHVCDLLNSGFYPSRSRALNHVVVRQLTSFYLSATWLDQYYGNFKIDLVNMLGSASSLKTLSICDSLTGTLMPTTFQVDLRHMSELQLPQLQELEITTTVRVFTSLELAIWGKQGGWANLKILAPFHGDLFSSFPGQVPQLDQLRVYRHDQWDSQELDAYMNTLRGSLLGPITKLQYVNGIYSWDLIPWFVLRRVCSTINELFISHHTFYDVSRNVPAPTAQNIHHLRNICPRLRVLHVDIVLYDEDWEFDLLRQLSLFKEPIRLRLYIFQPNADDDDIWDFPTHSNCRRAFDYMAAEREREDLPML